MEVKSEVIESDQENPFGSSHLKNALKGNVSNFNTTNVATTTKNADYVSSLDTDVGLRDPLKNETQIKEKLITSTGDLGLVIFKPPFFEIVSIFPR